MSDEGGDPSCWLGLVCPECGRIREDRTAQICPHCGTPVEEGPATEPPRSSGPGRPRTG
ncbi:zinc-ribbon domain-containing protein [Streptomyces sp. A7024]|uniref:Zinc-ribbon domain-containing protein n=1 Tax=Streptomyces coryli TaxID=1128680 RepID=A0A6G4TV36_9ACTN|nr:zinc-ribbon domain-containing protein [Streptomyces coryli]NGN63390.1 zinc-ribbon domain-containing protein [Streptomyces coryli]